MSWVIFALIYTPPHPVMSECVISSHMTRSVRRLSRRAQDYGTLVLEDEQEQSREGAKAGIPTSAGCGTHADRENARVPAMTALLMLVGCQARSSEGNGEHPLPVWSSQP